MHGILPREQAEGEWGVQVTQPFEGRRPPARLLTTLAIASGIAAVILLVAFSRGDGEDDGGVGEAIAGLLIVFAPVLCAAITRSVLGSRLLRPVGVVAVLISGLAALVHVSLVLEDHGASGWIIGFPATATPVLLLAAVVSGSPRPGPTETMAGLSAPLEEVTQSWLHGGEPAPGGPPLDVLNPLRHARSHAVKDVLAWVLAGVVVAAPGVPVFRLLGWPVVVDRVDAEIVEIAPVDGGTAGTFEARVDGRLGAGPRCGRTRPTRWGTAVAPSWTTTAPFTGMSSSVSPASRCSSPYSWS